MSRRGPLILLMAALALLVAGICLHYPMELAWLRDGAFQLWLFPLFFGLISIVSIILAWMWHNSLLQARIEGEQLQRREVAQRTLAQQETFERQEWHRGMFLRNPLAILLFDPRTLLIVDANDSACEFYGRSHAELTNMLLSQVSLLPDDQLHEMVDDIIKQGAMRLNSKHRLADGSVREVLVTCGSLVMTWQTRMFSIVQDVTAQVQAEESVRRLVEASPMGVHIWRLVEGRLIFSGYNKAADDILHFSHAHLIGKPIEEAFPAPALVPIAKRYREIATDGGQWQFENFAYSDDQLAGVYDIVAFQVAPGCMLAMFSDATTRHRSQQLLLRAERRLRMLYEHSPVGIATVDLDNLTVRDANAAFQQIAGYSEAELAGKVFCDLSGLGQFGITREMFQTDRPATMELPCVCHEEKKWIEMLLCPMPSEDASGQVGLVVVQDITLRKEGEESLRQAKTMAENANAAKDQFLAALSHELRTPLTPVLLLTQSLIMDRETPQNIRDDLASIQRNVELEARLIDDLLDLTRITRGKLQMHMTSLDVHVPIRHAVEICKGEAERKHIRLELWLEAVHSTVQADPSRLQQVFWNLIKNAIKFTRENGLIVVHTRNDHQTYTPDDHPEFICEVLDTGMGMDSTFLSRIFNPFEQGAEDIARMFGGLGMGLAICKAIVEQHHGRIDAYSDGRGKGAVFGVYLQTISPGIEEPRAVSSPAMAPPMTLRVLLVEDHEMTARIMARLLGACGYEVFTAGDVKTALRIADEQELDLLISDLGLPDGSGIDVVTHVRKTRQIPAIALSGYGMEHDIRNSLEAGFNEHLIKPVNLAHLQGTITRVMSAR